MAETSDRVSAIAARLRALTERQLIEAALNPRKARQMVLDIRSVAASAQRQDETKGKRPGFIKRLLGKR